MWSSPTPRSNGAINMNNDPAGFLYNIRHVAGAVRRDMSLSVLSDGWHVKLFL
ncbi:predicted protein [Arabidopsis lyrata subsp. lyrata]|uniref:Predicted protein n=1 Tax=Arabidopsis lyrata subsp. lyrata TaxID=81972 RepID=D7KKZ5_ARALL|nr:predicted protein [Arabidopsis lyrata subsp. lyrata]